LTSARGEEALLADGRVQLHGEDDLLRRLTTPTLVPCWRSIDGGVEVDGRIHSRDSSGARSTVFRST
jgi:hypothetical protein